MPDDADPTDNDTGKLDRMAILLSTIGKQAELLKTMTEERDYYRRMWDGVLALRDQHEDTFVSACKAAGHDTHGELLIDSAAWLANEVKRIVRVLDEAAAPADHTAAARVRLVTTDWKRLKRGTGQLPRHDDERRREEPGEQ